MFVTVTLGETDADLDLFVEIRGAVAIRLSIFIMDANGTLSDLEVLTPFLEARPIFPAREAN